MKRSTIAVALSGGIDSLYTAWRLKKEGHNLIGIHFVTGYEISRIKSDDAPCEQLTLHSDTGKPAIPAMNHMASQLEIPIHIIDIREIFQKKVVVPFIDAYKSGQTPNPCQLCNPTIKFGLLLEVAQSLGAKTLATGHYVRTKKDEAGRLHILKGSDPTKDQSYFLAMVPPENLARAIFPLGEMAKEEVKKEAFKAGLSSFAKGESQDICFIQGGDYKEFLLGQKGFSMTPGPITLEDGTEVGKHQGLHGFTIGQRRGINCPGPYPYYVLALRPDENRLVVGKKESLLKTSCRVRDLNWIQPPESLTFQTTCKIRYSHKGASATLTWDPETQNGQITFESPQSAVTPGQGAVFYADDEVIGGGWII